MTTHVYRSIVKSRLIQTKSMPRGGARIIELLECGHVERRKASAGFARVRKCRACEYIKESEGECPPVKLLWEKSERKNDPIFTRKPGQLRRRK